jgi:hypothetical protein
MKRKTVSTSKDLLNFYPFLEGQKGWTKFASKFDKPEFRKHRMEAARARRGPKQSKIVRDCLNHSSWIINAEALANMPICETDSSERFLTPEELLESQKSSAMILAKAFKLLLTDSRDGNRLRDEIMKEIERLRTIAPSRNIAEACEAFFRFIERENRLPTKQETNWEANHIYHGKIEEFHIKSRMKDGDHLEKNGKQYRAYGCYEDLRMDDQYCDFSGIACKLVPAEEWKQLRWEDASNSSHLWKSCGFSGLPEGKRGKVGKRQR